MKIKDLQKDIEESLASLPASSLPPQLEALRHLSAGGFNPQVSFRRVQDNRKLREDAAASYFDPASYEVVISFVPFPELQPESEVDVLEGTTTPFDPDDAIVQLIDELKKAEATKPFVGLKWFRDQFLPEKEYSWARDPMTSGSLLRRATEQGLVLTSQVPNAYQPLHPVTAIRVNRSHPRFQTNILKQGPIFKPFPISGGSVSETILNDRR